MLFGLGGLAAWGCRLTALTGLPFAREILPWAPPAILGLTAYLGLRINQTRIFLAALAFLPAELVLAYPRWFVPDAVTLVALALPSSLAAVFVVPEGPLTGERGLLRLLLAAVPFPALAAFLALDPAGFAELAGWRLAGLPGGGALHATFAGALPLVLLAIVLRHDRAGPFLPACLAALLPALAAGGSGTVSDGLAVAGAVGGAESALPRAAIAFTAAAGIQLYTVIWMFWQRAYLDELTGLPNRRALEEEMVGLSPPYAVAMIDLDHFKRFNDEHGHAHGDQALRYAATLLRDALGAHVYRFGGEEFCALLRGRDEAAAAALAERARRTFEDQPFRLRAGGRWRGPAARGAKGGGGPLTFTCSVGVAASRGDHEPPDRVRARADEALYRAKSSGRNRVVAAGPA